MVLTDAFPIYMELAAICYNKAVTVAAGFFETLICRHGVPENVASERSFSTTIGRKWSSWDWTTIYHLHIILSPMPMLRHATKP